MLNQVASPEMDQETGSLLEVADVVVREVLEVLVVTAVFQEGIPVEMVVFQEGIRAVDCREGITVEVVVFLEGIPEVVVFLEDILEAVAFQGVSLLAHQDTE